MAGSASNINGSFSSPSLDNRRNDIAAKQDDVPNFAAVVHLLGLGTLDTTLDPATEHYYKRKLMALREQCLAFSKRIVVCCEKRIKEAQTSHKGKLNTVFPDPYTHIKVGQKFKIGSIALFRENFVVIGHCPRKPKNSVICVKELFLKATASTPDGFPYVYADTELVSETIKSNIHNLECAPSSALPTIEEYENYINFGIKCRARVHEAPIHWDFIVNPLRVVDTRSGVNKPPMHEGPYKLYDYRRGEKKPYLIQHQNGSTTVVSQQWFDKYVKVWTDPTPASQNDEDNTVVEVREVGLDERLRIRQAEAKADGRTFDLTTGEEPTQKRMRIVKNE